MYFLILLPLCFSFFADGAKSEINSIFLCCLILLLSIIVVLRSSKIKIPFAGFFLFSLFFMLCSVIHAVYGYASIVSFMKYASYMAYFLLVYNFFNTHHYRKNFLLMVMFGLIGAGTIYWQFIHKVDWNYLFNPAHGFIWGLVHISVELRGIFSSNTTYSATLLSLVMIICVTLMMTGELKPRKTLMIIITILPALFLLQSRGPIIGFIVSLVIILIQRKKYSILLYLLTGGFLFIVLVPTEYFILGLLHLENKYVWGRLCIWLTSLNIIVSHPFSGFGLGNYEIAYNLFRLPFDDGVARFLNSTPLAHNDFLQIAVESGIPVLCLGCYVLFKTLFASIKQTRKNPILLISSSAVVLLMTIAMVQFPFYLPFFNLVLCIFFAHMVSVMYKDRYYVISTGRKIYTVCTCVMLMAMVVIGKSGVLNIADHNVFVSTEYLKQKTYDLCSDADELNYSEKFPKIISLSNDIMQRNPADTDFFERMGRFWDGIYQLTNERKYLYLSLNALLQSAEFNPANAFLWEYMGTMLFSQHAYELALKMYDNAVNAEPRFQKALLQKAICENILGNYDASYITFLNIFKNASLRAGGEPGKSFKSALLDINYAKLYASYAGYLFQTKKIAMAKRFITRALKLDPHNMLYKNNLNLITAYEK